MARCCRQHQLCRLAKCCRLGLPRGGNATNGQPGPSRFGGHCVCQPREQACCDWRVASAQGRGCSKRICCSGGLGPCSEHGLETLVFCFSDGCQQHLPILHAAPVCRPLDFLQLKVPLPFGTWHGLSCSTSLNGFAHANRHCCLVNPDPFHSAVFG